MTNFKEKLKQGQVVLGTHTCINDPVGTEIFGDCGFDYVWIDMEHTGITLDIIQLHLLAARATNTPAIVRVLWNELYLVKPVLEMGASGIVFPMISNAEQAEKAVSYCKYPPAGVRGFGPKRAVRYGLDDVGQYIREKGSDIMVFTQIETVAAVKNLDEMLKVDGITAFIIGPMDLSGSYGHFGDIRHPVVDKVTDEVIARIHRAGKYVGTSVGDYSEDSFNYWIKKGIDFISAGSELDYMISGGKETLANARKALSKAGRKQL
ncbi:aldolase/citrate lyase family protein [Marispirochaeta sp.]|uniref:HpcH/HpaI aldolase family protein n=1 Tax=Marispirochaeta sp. TaxID=2038653 RepID=UPI0029C90A8E|nr:aldolase/citrate lyase family protein [Marispirochaeta sp.]